VTNNMKMHNKRNGPVIPKGGGGKRKTIVTIANPLPNRDTF